MKIVMVLPAENFREEELEIPLSCFHQKNFSVLLASTTKLPLKGHAGKEVLAHLLLSEVEEKNFHAVVFVGGNGTRNLWENPTALRIAQKFWEKKKIVAGICYGAVIPFKAGLGKNFHATTYPDALDEIRKAGGWVAEKEVVQDDHLITASGPHVALEFAGMIAKALEKS